MKRKSSKLRRLLQSHRKRLSNEMDFWTKYHKELRGCWIPAQWHKSEKGKMIFTPEIYFDAVPEHLEELRTIAACQDEIEHVDELLGGNAVVVLHESNGLPEEGPEKRV